MAQHPLQVIAVSSSREPSLKAPNSRFFEKERTQKLQAKFERMWLIHPEQFDPMRNCLEKERIQRTWRFITNHTNPKGKQAADIGCGWGLFSTYLSENGATVDAVDIARNALKRLKEKQLTGVSLLCDAMPNTVLDDDKYDLIICTDLIAELEPQDHRLFFAELSRLIKPNGLLFCSSDIDIDTEGGTEKFLSMAQTEFNILDTEPSYHRMHIRLKRFFERPAFFIEGRGNSRERKKQLESKTGFSFGWYWINTTPPLAWFWTIVNFASAPIVKILRTNRELLLFLEKISRWLWNDEGISHYLFVAKRRPLQVTDPEDIPIERLGKREIWT